MHSDHDSVDDCDDCDERAPMRVLYLYALDHQCIRLLGVLHLGLSFFDRFRNIELFA